MRESSLANWVTIRLTASYAAEEIQHAHQDLGSRIDRSHGAVIDVGESLETCTASSIVNNLSLRKLSSLVTRYGR